ncbi:MAG: hypothetical protein LQ339_003784 [Xanthoria mediterranea]|nr:MAG: hypothetical protein LQ339_003784 [Xanthoria mediterranea]
MAPIPIPEEGLVLQGASPSPSADAAVGTQSQVMRLDLASGVLEDIMRASKMGKDVHMSFGKNVTLHYGTRSQQLLSIAQPTPSELYNYTPDEEDELRFAGLFTHKLAQKKVQENTAVVDAAMETLKSKMADHQQNKNNKKIKVLSATPTASPRIITNYVKPKPTSFFAQIPKRKPPVVRSVPTSPAVGPAHPVAAYPSSANTPGEYTSTKEKMEALKIPLLHLVAIRPMSLKFLANKIACSQEECKKVLEKFGKPFRLDTTKWDLTDKAFKELSVWDFKYDLDDDRELAIERAVSAFDRLRLSREDREWQMLLPTEERDKGKILSRLQVHQGPMQKSATPRIHVQETADDEGNDNGPAQSEGHEKQHLAPTDAAAPSARTQSSDQPKKKRISEQEAQAKRLLSSGPKKAAAAAAAKAKDVKSKDMTKRKVTKKEGSVQANVKSAEFVHDSDEDEEEAKVPATSELRSAANKKPSGATPKALPGTKPQAAAADSGKRLPGTDKPHKGTKGSNESIVQMVNSVRSPSTAGTPTSKQRLSDVSQTSSSGPRVARQRTTSSPHKPSPLGSSPPTNASDFDNDSQPHITSNSSTSSTPLNAQSRNQGTGLKTRPEASKRLPDPGEKSSQASLKRKADESVSGSSSVDNRPLTNGPTASAAKRVKTSVPTPPATESGSSESSPVSDNVLDQAQRFKSFYERYQKMYREVSTEANAAPEKVERLMKMHERVQSMKDHIGRAVVYK